MPVKSRRINIFGGPGSGKSTLAASVFAQLKVEGQDIEHVSEFIKDWSYMGIKPQGRDQLYIFAQQMRAEEVKLRHVDMIVTDSPLLLNAAYSEFYGCKFSDTLIKEAKEFDKDYPPINFLIKREVEYKQKGRYQNCEDALVFDDHLLRFLNSHLTGCLITLRVNQLFDLIDQIRHTERD